MNRPFSYPDISRNVEDSKMYHIQKNFSFNRGDCRRNFWISSRGIFSPSLSNKNKEEEDVFVVGSTSVSSFLRGEEDVWTALSGVAFA